MLYYTYLVIAKRRHNKHVIVQSQNTLPVQNNRKELRCENNKNTISDYKLVDTLNSVVVILRFSTLTVLGILSVNSVKIN